MLEPTGAGGGEQNGAAVDSGSHTAAACAHTGSSARRNSALTAHFGDICLVDNDDDIWKKRGGPANSHLRKQGRSLPESAVSSPSRRICIFFSFFLFSYALLSLMCKRMCSLQLTSIDATSPLSLEREEGMGGLGGRAQPRRCSALFRRRAGSRPHSTPWNKL